jgi:hypothetical protein
MNCPNDIRTIRTGSIFRAQRDNGTLVGVGINRWKAVEDLYRTENIADCNAQRTSDHKEKANGSETTR